MKHDLIKREDALNVLKLFGYLPLDSLYYTIEHDLPSADRPQGHYIKEESGEWYCSECKRIDDKYSVAKFCWYCGARMKGADDDNA